MSISERRNQLIILMLVFVFAAENVLSSHFRGAVIMVRPRLGRTANEMEISYQISWRRSFSGLECDSANVNNGDLINGGATLSCQYGCSGTIISPMSYVCTHFSIEDDWVFGEYHFTYIFNNVSNQNAVTIGTSGVNWIREVGDGNWNVSTTFSLVARIDTGQINSSPQVSSSLPLCLQQGCSYAIPLPISDPDNDIIRCRWATEGECGSICNGLPGANLDSSSCIIAYIANDGVGLKAAAIIIEDYAHGSLNRPLSSVALQFIVSVVNSSQPCSMQPHCCRFPSIILHPSNKTVILNGTITLTCMANDTSSYYWEKENEDIPFNAFGVDTNTLTLNNVQPENDGNYRCVAFTCGVTSRTFSIYARITVVAVPVFVSHPSSQYIYTTQTATFTCNASGYNVSYQWRIRTGSFPSKVLGIHSNTLIIPNVTSSDENAYTCMAINVAGSEMSHTAILTVTDCPQQMIYMQCGHYATCHFLNASISRSLECESGCFCEDDKVHYNESCSVVDICDCEIGIADVVFILDASENIGSSNFQLIKEFTYNLTSLLNIGPTRSQIAIILYSSNASLHFNLNDHRSKETLLQDIYDIPYYDNGEESNIAVALNLLYLSYIDGSLKARDDHNHIAILFTDGLPDNFTATRTVANNLHSDTDFQIYVIETNGTTPVAAEYTEIALDPSYVLPATNFSELALQQAMERIVQNLDSKLTRLCNVLTVSDNVAIYPGETATFYCNGSSYEAFGSTYEWEKVELDGDKIVIISSDNDMESSGSAFGSGFDYSNILTVSNINFTDNGVGYYCRAAGFSNSDVAYINVLMPSVHSIPMTPLLLQAFSSTPITCTAQGGPRLIIRWYRENQLILSGQTGNTSLTYQILNANVSDNGNYTCAAVVDDYEINSTFINVLVSPVIIIGIVNTTAIESENVTLRCQTTYSINTTVTWKVNGNDVDISNVSKYRIMKRVISENIVESNLMIVSVTLSDVGMYACVAENEAGNDTSNGVLRVNVPPSFLPAASDRAVTNVLSEKVILTCTAVGLPAPNITWFDAINGAISNSNRTVINATHNLGITSLIEVTSTLEILSPQNVDGGIYRCTADNGLSVSVNMTILLLVLDPLSVLNFNGYQVEPGAIINTFVSSSDDFDNISGSGSGSEINFKELSLMCNALSSDDNVRWMVINFSNNDSFTVNTTTVNSSLSNITVRISEGELTIACISEQYKESINITITTENPYVRLLGNSNISAALGTRQELEFVIAIDSDGSNLQQSSVLNMVNFMFDNLIDTTSLQLMESIEFQHYTYTSPPVDDSSVGIYAIAFDNRTLTNATIALNNRVPVLKISPINVTPLEGQPITLECSTSEDQVVVKWLFNGTKIELDDERYKFSPPGLNNNLTIINPSTSESGNYSCEIDVDSVVEMKPVTVNITVFAACQSDFANGILWNATKRNQTSSLKCSSLHSNFRDGLQITRSCNSDGSWSSVNVIDCTMHITSPSLVILSVILSEDTQQNYSQLAENITSITIEAENNLINPKYQLFSFNASGNYFVAMHISFEMDSQLSENVTSEISTVINSYLSSTTFTLEVIGYLPSNICSCIATREDSMKSVCTGPSGTPPCICIENNSCQCNEPIFVGNGTLCGKDTDGDKFPDGQLNCTQDSLYCQQDECPGFYSNSTDNNGCPRTLPNNTGCRMEVDRIWKILWPATIAGETAVQKCPGGIESIGFATRVCDKDQMWNNDLLDVSQCQSVEIANILEDTEALNNTATLSDLNEITNRISSVLNSTEPVLPKDLQSTNQILNTVLSLASEADGDPANVTKEVIGAIDMVLESRNFPSFEAAETNESSEILGTTEKAAKILGSTREGSRKPLVLPGNNLFVEVQSSQGSDTVKFPSDISAFNDGIELNIPVGVNDTVVNFIATTLGYLLQSTQGQIRSSVVSSQISKPLPKDKSVTLDFNIIKDNISNPSAGCYFWNFTKGEWSNSGITVTEMDATSIQCTSSHLTSFAVLVAPAGEDDNLPLSVVSYIGCSISIVCLLLTICVIFLWRKHIFNQVQHYIHFNLSMSLLLGLIVFVSGIETATDSNVGCLIVAVLLHYFFLAAFCWMLCEGLLIFILLYYVFYKGFYKGWKFFTLIGWGLPIPVVVVSVAVSHEQYGNDRACWISNENGAIWAFIAPMILIIMVNVFFIIMTLRRIYQTRRNRLSAEAASYTDIARSVAKAACVLLPLLGITWVLGIFAVNEKAVAFAWVFTILNSLQGAFIFILHVLRNDKFQERIKAIRKGNISKLFTSTGGEYTLKTATLPKEPASSTNGTDYNTNTVKILDSYNKVIRNEYTVSSTNLAPEYYQKHEQTVPNPFNMANTVDEYAFDEDDTIQSMRRKRLSTNINIPPSEYLHRNRQAVVFSNTLMNDEGEDITSL